MSEIKQKFIGSTPLSKEPQKPLAFKIKPGSVSPDVFPDGSIGANKLAPNAVGTEHIQDGAVTAEKLAGGIGNAIISMVMQDLDKIWAKIAEITGEQLQDLHFDVTPKYFISEEPVPVHISASSVGNNGSFDYIAFYINGVKVIDASGVDTLEFDTEISDTSEIKYEATILGTDYADSAVVVHYNSYWLGAGKNYQEVMDIAHIIPITSGLRGAYDIVFEQGDHLYVILSRSLRDQFIRADMNSFEIPFNETVITVDDREYCVLESINAYMAGTYNIDING